MSDVKSRAFIDTNIWLYAFNNTQDPKKTIVATKLIRSTPHIHISTQIINEVCYNLLRKFGADEVAVRKLIRSLYRKYVVAEIDQATLIQASQIRSSYTLSYWDGIVVSSAVIAGATVLYSEDMQHGLVINQNLTIINPFRST